MQYIFKSFKIDGIVWKFKRKYGWNSRDILALK